MGSNILLRNFEGHLFHHWLYCMYQLHNNSLLDNRQMKEHNHLQYHNGKYILQGTGCMTLQEVSHKKLYSSHLDIE